MGSDRPFNDVRHRLGNVRWLRRLLRYPPRPEWEVVPEPEAEAEPGALPQTGIEAEPAEDAVPGAEPRSGEDLSGGAVWIDEPWPGMVVDREPFHIRGWGFIEASPIDRIEILIGGRLAGRARLGLPRADTASYYGDLRAGASGWEFLVTSEQLAAIAGPRFEVQARSISADGDVFETAIVRAELQPAGRLTPDQEQRIVQLRSRFPAASGSTNGSSPRSDPLELVVFTHHLGLGGGQLYLYELLRRMGEVLDFNAVVVAPEDGPLRARFEHLGIAVQVSGHTPMGDPEAYEGRLAHLGAWLQSRNPDAVIANSLASFAGVDAAVRLGLPAMWAIHESMALDDFWALAYPPGHVDRHVRARARDAARGSAALIFESDATRALFAPVTRGPGHAVTVPYGIDVAAIEAHRADVDRAAVRRDLGIASDARVLLCMATLEPRKSQTVLAQAFARICRRYPDAFLAFVGDQGVSPYSDALREVLRTSGTQRQATVRPMTDRIYDWYLAADVLVSASDVESMPRSALEAMLFERPYVAADVFGVPELITDGETGFLFGSRDVGELERALVAVLELGEDELRAVGRNSRELVAGGHDSAGYARFYADRLRELARRTAVATPARQTNPSR
jgi:D-inositol-3-phosphate glycosyltransferase